MQAHYEKGEYLEGKTINHKKIKMYVCERLIGADPKTKKPILCGETMVLAETLPGETHRFDKMFNMRSEFQHVDIDEAHRLAHQARQVALL